VKLLVSSRARTSSLSRPRCEFCAVRFGIYVAAVCVAALSVGWTFRRVGRKGGSDIRPFLSLLAAMIATQTGLGALPHDVLSLIDGFRRPRRPRTNDRPVFGA
jgi:hypothetical protein